MILVLNLENGRTFQLLGFLKVMHDDLSIEICTITCLSIIFKAKFPCFYNMERDEPRVTKRRSSGICNQQTASRNIKKSFKKDYTKNRP